MAKICPCKDCVPPERHPGCHPECEKYLAWSAERQQELAKIHKMLREESDCFPNHLRNGRKRRKK